MSIFKPQPPWPGVSPKLGLLAVRRDARTSTFFTCGPPKTVYSNTYSPNSSGTEGEVCNEEIPGTHALLFELLPKPDC